MANKLRLILLCSVLILIYGCTAGRKLQRTDGQPWSTEDVVARYLDRSDAWTSMRTKVKVTVASGDSSISARGHIIYLIGEKYEIGFAPPYNNVLGTLYFTPEQFIYWDLQITPKVFNAKDTVVLSQIFPIRMPNWDPRDLLPFPISGRNGGFQTDSVWYESNHTILRGTVGTAVHILTISQEEGIIVCETIQRPGRDPLYKTFESIRSVNDWPVARRVSCRDASDQYLLAWSLGKIELDAAPFHSRHVNPNPQDAGTPHGN